MSLPHPSLPLSPSLPLLTPNRNRHQKKVRSAQFFNTGGDGFGSVTIWSSLFHPRWPSSLPSSSSARHPCASSSKPSVSHFYCVFSASSRPLDRFQQPNQRTEEENFSFDHHGFTVVLFIAHFLYHVCVFPRISVTSTCRTKYQDPQGIDKLLSSSSLDSSPRTSTPRDFTANLLSKRPQLSRKSNQIGNQPPSYLTRHASSQCSWSSKHDGNSALLYIDRPNLGSSLKPLLQFQKTVRLSPPRAVGCRASRVRERPEEGLRCVIKASLIGALVRPRSDLLRPSP